MEAAPMTRIGEEHTSPTTHNTAAEESKEPVLPKFQFSCKKCRKVLFTEDNLEEHMSQVKAYNTKTHSVKVGHQELCS